MANKPLKTLTFEGLNDTYTVPQVDATLAVTGDAADAKVTGDTLAEKADKDGVIATAEGLIGGAYTVEKEPYHFRKTAVDLAGRLEETIVGGSLAWNQLCNGSSVTVESGHKYIAKISGAFSIGASTGTAITGLTSGTDMVTDLTLLFGTTIADYIYSLETATAGAGIAWVKRYIDLDTYHEYDAGSIQSVEGLVRHDVVGVNQTEPLTMIATSTNLRVPSVFRNDYVIKIHNGFYYGSDSHSRGVSFLCGKFSKGDVVTFSANSNVNLYRFGYTSEIPSGTAIVTQTMFWNSNNNLGAWTFTCPADGYYWANFWNSSQAYPWIIENIQCEYGTFATLYHPYEKHSYPLDSSVTLRGVPKLVTDHIEFDGDKYLSDGQVNRRYGVVDLGTLTWNRNTSYDNPFFLANFNVAKDMGNGICDKYLVKSTHSEMVANDKSLILYNGTIRLRDDSYSDAASFKTAMSGVYLVYALATPTTETAQPFQSPQLAGSTEEYVTTGVVPVGHESKYYEDVAKKVNGLPKDFSTLIAPTEVTFTATRNYTVGSFVIVNNQLYKVTSAISSGGTITPNSNVTATTIMAEILALA